jgi:negative regulator of sigma E activity
MIKIAKGSKYIANMKQTNKFQITVLCHGNAGMHSTDARHISQQGTDYPELIL